MTDAVVDDTDDDDDDDDDDDEIEDSDLACDDASEKGARDLLLALNCFLHNTMFCASDSYVLCCQNHINGR